MAEKPCSAHQYKMLAVAPFLWNREKIRKDKNDEIVKLATSVTQGMRISSDSMDEIMTMLRETAITLRVLTKSDRVFLYSVDAASQQIVHVPIDGELSTQADSITWPIRMGRNVAAHVTLNKECVMVNDLNKDDRFPDGTGWGDRLTTSVICVPVLTLGEECYAIVELTRVGGADYAQTDLDLVTVVTGWMGSTIEQHQHRLLGLSSTRIECELNDIMQSYMANEVDFDWALGAILGVAKDVLGAEYAAFYRFERPVIRSGDSGMYTYNPPLHQNDSQVLVVMKNNIDAIAGLVGLCTDTGKIINIEDSASDYRFNPRLDAKPWIAMRSLMYVPIVDESGKLGVMQMINKVHNGSVFVVEDESAVQVFGTYLMKMLKFKADAVALQYSKYFNLTMNDVMLNRLTIRIVKTPFVIPKHKSITEPPNFQRFKWYPYPKYMNNMVNLTYKMITDICGDHLLDQTTMYAFILKVKQLHRPVPFHNFEHGFTALHGVFCCLKRIPAERFNWVEKLSMMLSALCRDLNHEGSTNAFLVKTKHPLSFIYPHSYREYHAAWLGENIINNTGILGRLSPAQRKEFFAQYNEHILSTDVHTFILHRIQLEQFYGSSASGEGVSGKIDWQNAEHRGLMRCLILTATNLSSQYKPFRANERLSAHLIEQLHAEGDLMCSIGLNAVPFHDSKMALPQPEIQMRILKIVALPCFQMLARFIPELHELYTSCKDQWRAYSEVIASSGQRTWFPDRSFIE